VWAENSDSDVRKDFQGDIKASFNGLVSAGSFDANIKDTEQYKTYEQSMGKTCNCLGGDGVLAAKIEADPTSDTVYKTYQAWSKTSSKYPKLLNFHTTPLWAIMYGAKDPTVMSYHTDVEKAYYHLAENPQIHKTRCRLTITTNWGQIALLSPAVFIAPDPNSPASAQNGETMSFARTKLTWDSNGSGQDAKTIE